MSEAKNLQKFTIEMSGTKDFLDKLPVLKARKNKPGLYVSYEIDEEELEDDGLDYCTPEIASVFAVDENGEESWLGCVRGYNWETFWLETAEDEEVDTAENWWEIILEEYNKILNLDKNGNNK